jgi:hypothetical protein
VNLQEATLDYAQRGWPVLPVGGAGDPKKPRIKDWRNAASTDPAVIAEWWSRWPDAGVAIVTGERSGVVAIDLDGDDIGSQAYGALLLEHSPPGSAAHPDGATIRTGRHGGGWRLLFALPEGASIRKGVIAPGVEFMGEGGSAIMPPSRHATGRRYVWADPIPADGLPVLAPAWVDLLSPSPRSVSVPAPAPAAFDGLGTLYGQAALRDELDQLAQAEPGTRNDTLNRASFAVGSLVAVGHLDLEAAVYELARVGQGIGLGGDEVAATIASGVHAGHQSPRRLKAA